MAASGGVQNSKPLDHFLYSIFGDSEEVVLNYIAYFNIFATGLVFVSLITLGKARYGRYRDKSGKMMPWRSNLVWSLMTLPAVTLPLVLVFFTEAKQLMSNPANVVCVVMYVAHYLHRAFIYSSSNRGGSPVPVELFVSGIFFTFCLGFLQGRYHTQYYMPSEEWIRDPRFVIGCILYVLGMAINVHSDHLLIHLRKPGETGYKIPRGGLFNYVSGANYFGETVEWIGYAIASWSLPGFTMAFITIANIGPRAFHHHEYYHRKFENYPKDRKAFIPFII